MREWASEDASNNRSKNSPHQTNFNRQTNWPYNNMYVVALTKPHGFNDLSIISDNANSSIETGHILIHRYIFVQLFGILFGASRYIFLSILRLHCLHSTRIVLFLVDKRDCYRHAFFFFNFFFFCMSTISRFINNKNAFVSSTKMISLPA